MPLEQQGRTLLRARDVIVRFLRDYDQMKPPVIREWAAEDLIACLSSAEPPILLCEESELRE